jgi:hypothetical protein
MSWPASCRALQAPRCRCSEALGLGRPGLPGRFSCRQTAEAIFVLITLLTPGVANAWSVNFEIYSYGENRHLVSGQITGLKDSARNQKYAPVEVTITSSLDRSVGTYYYGNGDSTTIREGKIIGVEGTPWK